LKARGFTAVFPAMAVYFLGWVLTAQVQPARTVASVPKVVRFTGTFHPANGLPTAPIESATFSIYAEQQGGTSLWHEVQNVTLDPDGHYTVLVGSTRNEGLLPELFSSLEPRWLGVQFNRPNEPEQPRVLLVSVPYALKAADADTLGGKPASAYLLAEPPAVPSSASDYPGVSRITNPAAGQVAPLTNGNPSNYIAQAQTTANVAPTQTTGPNIAANPLAYSGVDIGAQINAAIAACTAGINCLVGVPSSGGTFSTTIILPTNVTLQGNGPQGSWLNYTGTGTAILVAGSYAQVRNLALNCTAACAFGINMIGASVIVDSVFLTGGTATSTLIGIHGGNGMISKIQASGVVGTIFECHGAVNNFLTDINIFGTQDNTTSRSLVIDSGCDATMIENFQSSFSGLHGLVAQNTLGGSPPHWLFARGFVTDQSTGGDGWLFDSTLGGATYVGFNFVDSWSSGAGEKADGTVATVGSNGVHISGGKGITIIGSKIRANAANGILIDNANVGYVHIQDSIINSNNAQNTTAYGISVTVNIDGLIIGGNTIGNLIGDVTGYQKYAINISSAGSSNVSITGNNLADNVLGPIVNNMPASSYIQNGNVGVAATGILYQQVASVGQGFGTPIIGTTLLTLSDMPANFLQVGDILDFYASGDESSGTGASAFQFEVVLGGLSITGCSANTLNAYLASKPWRLKLRGTVRAIGTSGSIESMEECISSTGASVLTQEMNQALSSVDTTSALTPSVKVATSPASGSFVTGNQFVLTVTRPK
jgi:hypothetical protein